MRFVRSLILAAGALALAGTASAQGLLDNFQVKVGVSGIQPDESATISTIGGTVDISDEYVPSLQIEYFFNDNVSVELLCCVATHDVQAINTSLGTVDLGKVSHFPPTVTAKYRWTDFGAFYDDELPAGGPVTSIDYDDSWGGALQVGFDYKLDDHWAINVDVRKIWISTDVTLTAGATINADVDINPLVVTVATGYRF
jgi:outer membrane protein